MLPAKSQKGIIQLGIIGLFVLTAGLFAVTKLVSNSDLTFFNIAEEAAGVEKESCKGCSGNMELRWDRNANGGKGGCKKRASSFCKERPPKKPTPTPFPKTPSPKPYPSWPPFTPKPSWLPTPTPNN